jgi:uncharacterized protein
MSDPAIPIDLDPLDAFLNSDRAPDESMHLSDLDGFLTGLVVGPQSVMPSEWLPVIWGGDEPEFQSADEARAVLGTIMARHNEIRHCLETDPETFEPVFWTGVDEDDVIVTDWAIGFLEAVKLRPAAWEPLIAHRRAGTLFAPILLLGSDPNSSGFEGQGPTEDEMVEILDDARDLIPECVVGIHAFWKERRGRAGAGPDRGNNRRSSRPR